LRKRETRGLIEPCCLGGDREIGGNMIGKVRVDRGCANRLNPPKARHQCLPLNQLDGVSKLSQTYQNGGLSVRTSLPNPKKGGYCSREPLTASDHLRS